MKRALAAAFMLAIATACGEGERVVEPPVEPPEPTTVTTTVETPDLLGLRLGPAKRTLRSLDLEAAIIKKFSHGAPGSVLNQLPSPGESVEPGFEVIVTVAKRPPIVPGVVGDALSRARNLLEKRGYDVKVIRRIDDRAAVGTVTSYRPSGRVMPGRSITLVVSKKAPAPPPPSPSCHSSYTGGCVPIASDVDCAGGSGNGPAYVAGPVTVVGPDVYGLDSDNDGLGCE